MDGPPPARAGRRRGAWAVVLLALGLCAASAAPGGTGRTGPPVAAPTGVQPTPENTGVPEGTVLETVREDLTITRPGAVLDGLDVHGFITVEAPNVTIRRSVVRGGLATFNRGVITNYGYDNLLVEDVDIVPEQPTVWQDGVKGSDFTLNRVHVTGNVDSVKVHGEGNVLIENSLLEYTSYYESDPNQGGGPTHNDGVQILEGADIRILNNTIRGQQNLPVLGAANKGDTVRLVVAGNWLDGGHCTMKLEELNGRQLEATVVRSRFGPNRDVEGCAIVATVGSDVQARENRYVDGTEVTPVWTDR